MITNEEAENIALDYYDRLLMFCRAHLRNKEDAADVAQETMLFFFEKAETLDEVNIRSWLLSVASLKIREQYREIMIETKFISYDDENFPDINVSAADYEYVDDEEIEKFKEKILARLSPEEYELFVQVYERKRRYSEIAEHFGISRNAISSRTYRLRNKIKKMAKITDLVIAFVLVKLKWF